MLSRITIGWHWLERTLNGIIAEVNAQKPLGSATIAVEESPNGTLLKVVGAQNQNQQSAGGGGRPMEGGWITVTVVNPATCAQSQIQVWARAVPAS
jgi:hypothetical protein